MFAGFILQLFRHVKFQIDICNYNKWHAHAHILPPLDSFQYMHVHVHHGTMYCLGYTMCIMCLIIYAEVYLPVLMQ